MMKVMQVIKWLSPVAYYLLTHGNWSHPENDTVWMGSWLDRWLAVCLADWLSGWLAGLITCWLTDWLSRLADWLAG